MPYTVFKGIRRFIFPIQHQFNSHNKTPLTNIPHMCQIPEPLQLLREIRDLGLQFLQRAICLKFLYRRKRSRTTERIARVRMPVKKRLHLRIIAQKGIVNLIRRQRRRHRKIPPGQPLSQAEQIGRDIFVFTGKHLARPTKTRSDLIHNQKHIVSLAQLSRVFEKTRRMHKHAPCPLHERFHDKSCEAVRVFGNNFLQRIKTRPITHPVAVFTPVRMRNGCGNRRKKQRPIHLVKMRDPPHAHRANRIAVIALRQVKKAILLSTRMRPLLPVLKRHLNRNFNRSRATIRIKNPAETPRRNLHQLLRKLNSRNIGQAQQRAMRHAVELRANSPVNLRNAMPIHIAPHRRKAIEIAIAVNIYEINTIAVRNNNGVLIRIISHLRKRMPDNRAVNILHKAFLLIGHFLFALRFRAWLRTDTPIRFAPLPLRKGSGVGPPRQPPAQLGDDAISRSCHRK